MKNIIILFLLSSFYTLQANDKPQIINSSVVYSVQDEKWADINDAVKDAIAEKGIVISYTSHAKALLDRTAAAVEVKQDTYLGAQIHLFCQVPLSHKMIKDNPHIISGCPYGISVYELNSNPGTIYVSYRKLMASEPAYDGVTKLQDEIVRIALDL
jgi:uncharacterized protein (DUF302 family)